MADTPTTPTEQSPPSIPNPVHVRLAFNAEKRIVGVSAARKLDLGPIQFDLPFATIKHLAAQIMAIEATAEMKASRSNLVLPQ